MMKEKILHVFFPNKCLSCKDVITREESLCYDCAKRECYIPKPACSFCGFEKKRCNCEDIVYAYNALAVPFYYEDVALHAIQNFKFYGSRHGSMYFAKAMANEVVLSFQEVKFTMVVPVPMTEKSRKRRGFNQSALLARTIAELLYIPYVENALVKVQETRQQHFLSAPERAGNIFGVFDVNSEIDLSGQTILLCDDIKTTGATLEECAKTLKIYGADAIYCVSACSTKQFDKS